jgi:hypothetical protein
LVEDTRQALVVTMRGRRYVAYVTLAADEHTRVARLARRRGLTVAGLIRRAINYLLLDEGDDTEPLVERKPHSGRRKRQHAA